jgi:hypothetical protein
MFRIDRTGKLEVILVDWDLWSPLDWPLDSNVIADYAQDTRFPKGTTAARTFHEFFLAQIGNALFRESENGKARKALLLHEKE